MTIRLTGARVKYNSPCELSYDGAGIDECRGLILQYHSRFCCPICLLSAGGIPSIYEPISLSATAQGMGINSILRLNVELSIC
jgi:hypothetical protein